MSSCPEHLSNNSWCILSIMILPLQGCSPGPPHSSPVWDEQEGAGFSPTKAAKAMKGKMLADLTFILGCKQFKILARRPGNNTLAWFCSFFFLEHFKENDIIMESVINLVRMTPSILDCKIKASHLSCQGLSFLTYKLGTPLPQSLWW